MIKILADENIPYGIDAFSTLGTVQLVAGRAISQEMLKDKDALIVRSITKVNKELLSGTAVRFVGTCTIGEDHVDKQYLEEQGIAFSSAPGCNADSVADYITGALLLLENHFSLALSQMTLGVVGVGNVGSRVVKRAQALGMTCILNDPPLAEKNGNSGYASLEEIVKCDIITFHTPLIKEGKWPTRHLVNEAFIASLKPETIIINTARGAVADNAALKSALRSNRIRAAVLDVWENEPSIDPELLALTFLGTPHIAGYSFDGKVNGTTQIYASLCSFLGVDAQWKADAVMPPPLCPEVTVDPDDPNCLLHAVSKVYDFKEDDSRMRELCSLPPDKIGVHFDLLRKQYPVRREFHNTRVLLTRQDNALASSLSGIGFTVT